jgi:hypothetical protein
MMQTFIKNVQFAALEKIVIKQLASDPLLAAQMVSLSAQFDTIPELKTIINYMQDYGGMPFLEWLNSKTAQYGVPDFSRTNYNCECYFELLSKFLKNIMFQILAPAVLWVC